MYEDSTETYCHIPLADLITVYTPLPDDTIAIVYCDQPRPLSSQEFCHTCEDSSPPPG